MSVVVMEESNTLPVTERQIGDKYSTLFFILSISIAVILLIIKPKLFAFGLIITVATAIIYILFHSSLYLLGLVVSIVRAKYQKTNLPNIRLQVVLHYIGNTLKALCFSSIPLGVLILLTFTILSIVPKTLKYQNPDLLNAILDPKGNPLYIEEAVNNRCIGVHNQKIDTLFFKLLYAQEDRQFLSQNNLLPQRSNWHGFALTSIRVFTGERGSSNINNQLIKNIAYPLDPPPQDISRKFSETTASFQLSNQMPPDHIINYYINSVSFCGGMGGNKGIAASSFMIFNKSVEELNSLQAFYLVRTLTNGTKYPMVTGSLIPYSEVEQHEAEIKRDLLLKAKTYMDKGYLIGKEMSRLKKCDLNFAISAYKSDIPTTTKEFLKKQIPLRENQKRTYYSSITYNNQQKLVAGVRKFEDQFKQYMRSGKFDLYLSAIALDVKTGKILAQFGGQGITDLTTFGNGLPMASLIKPFVLLEMLSEGKAVRLYDGKIRGKHTPENFNHHYSNKYVGVSEIIKFSLNAAMVYIREVMSAIELYSKVENHFEQMGIPKDPDLKIEDKYRKQEIEDNYPLGSRRMRLIDIAQAYQVLLNDGFFVKLSAIQTEFNSYTNEVERLDSTHGKRIYKSEDTHVIKDALTQTIHGGTASTIEKILPPGKDYYVKTGTSEDAARGYCVLSDGDILIVSFLNYGVINGTHLELNKVPPIPLKSGGKTATILAANIFNELTSK